MGKLIKKESNPIIELKHSDHNKLDLFKPYQKDTLLFTTFIVKEKDREDDFVDLILDLSEGDKLDLFRDTNNTNPESIVVKTKGGDILGYIPSYESTIPSRLMDSGKYLYSKIRHIRKRQVQEENGVLNVYHATADIDVYMKG